MPEVKLPVQLVLDLRDECELKHFIEGGTYYGLTSFWASQHFDRVTTIEMAKEIYDQTVAQYGDIKNIDFINGDTREELNKIAPTLDGPAFFWLDAHWSVGTTYGESDECPILDELLILVNSPHPHIMFIDDARYFLSPPPRPHSVDQWPTIEQVIQTLQSGRHEFYIVVIHDMIIAVPIDDKKLVASYCQEINTCLHYRDTSTERGHRSVPKWFHYLKLLLLKMRRSLKG